MKTKTVWILALAALLLSVSFGSWKAFGQTAGDDLAVALANHGMDPVTAPVAAAAIEIAIANNNALLKRVSDDEAAILTLKQQVAALQPPAAPASLFALSISSSADRSGAVNLNGSTVKGGVFIFTSSATALQNANPGGISSVCYWLDNPAATGAAAHCESGAPYDFQGGTPTAAISWSSASVPNGTHTVTQKIAQASGASETDTATFTVSN